MSESLTRLGADNNCQKQIETTPQRALNSGLNFLFSTGCMDIGWKHAISETQLYDTLVTDGKKFRVKKVYWGHNPENLYNILL